MARGGAWVERIALPARWTPPTSTEIGVVVKSGIAAGVAWFAARAVTDVPEPVLAPLTALVVVQVSVRASLRAAVQRSAAVVAGVLLAIAIGDALTLNAFTVALLVTASLAIAQLVVRLPTPAARQVPISLLVVLSALAAHDNTSSWRRVVDTLVGAVVGVVVSLVLPASRVVDARQTLERLGSSLGTLLVDMGEGLRAPWSTEQTAGWRQEARSTRERLVAQTEEAVGNSREVSKWNVRDRRHVEELNRYEEVLPRFERTAIGVSVISRGLDDHARLSGGGHPPMPAMGGLLVALAVLVRALLSEVRGVGPPGRVADAAAAVRARRAACVRGALRRAQLAGGEAAEDEAAEAEGEWLSYAAILVQVDRIVADLRAPLPP